MHFLVYFSFPCLSSVTCQWDRLSDSQLAFGQRANSQKLPSWAAARCKMLSPSSPRVRCAKSLRSCLSYTLGEDVVFGARKSREAQQSSLAPSLGDLPAIPWKGITDVKLDSRTEEGPSCIFGY